MSDLPTRFVARAPLRLDFAGGYTDVAPFVSAEGGAVTNVAISVMATAELELGGAGIRLISEDLRDELVLKGPADLRYDGQLDLLKAALNLLPVASPLRLATRCDAPPGSGLGLSGAIDVALAAVLMAARGETCSPEAVADVAYIAETQEARLVGGKQDQYASALGGAHLFRFRESDVEVIDLELPSDFREILFDHLVVVYTGESRASGEVHDAVWRAYGAAEAQVVEALRGLKTCAEEAADALRQGDLEQLGDVVNRNWQHQRALTPALETPRMREFFDLAQDHGVLGGKAAGAGGGGCVFFLCREPANLRDAIGEQGGEVLDVGYAERGVEVEVR